MACRKQSSCTLRCDVAPVLLPLTYAFALTTLPGPDAVVRGSGAKGRHARGGCEGGDERYHKGGLNPHRPGEHVSLQITEDRSVWVRVKERFIHGCNVNSIFVNRSG